MDDRKKRTLTLVGISLVAVILGVIAVLTAMRLRELATVPVAPNAPESQPQAALAPVSINGCFGSFDIGPQTCGETCTQDSDCASAGSITLRCISGVCVNPQCTENTTTCVCPTPTQTPGPTPSPIPSETPGPTPTLTPTPTVTPSPTIGPSPTPGPSLTPTPSNTPTPTPTRTPTPTPTNTPIPTVTVTPVPQVSCNGTCVSDSQCGSGLVCYEGRCRNSACVTEASCVCTVAQGPTPTPQPTVVAQGPTPVPTVAQPEIPVAGTTAPTLTILSIGTLILLAGFGILLVW